LVTAVAALLLSWLARPRAPLDHHQLPEVPAA